MWTPISAVPKRQLNLITHSLELWLSVNSHYDYVIMTMLASQITSLTVVYSIVYSGVNQRKHQSSASLAFVREIHRGPVNFPHKWSVTRKMFPFDDVIMIHQYLGHRWYQDILFAFSQSVFPFIHATHCANSHGAIFSSRKRFIWDW